MMKNLFNLLISACFLILTKSSIILCCQVIICGLLKRCIELFWKLLHILDLDWVHSKTIWKWLCCFSYFSILFPSLGPHSGLREIKTISIEILFDDIFSNINKVRYHTPEPFDAQLQTCNWTYNKLLYKRLSCCLSCFSLTQPASSPFFSFSYRGDQQNKQKEIVVSTAGSTSLLIFKPPAEDQ